MKNQLYLILIFFFSFNLYSSQKSQNIDYLFAGKVHLDTKEVFTLPLEDTDTGLLISVSINGKSYRFLVDTGASVSVLNDQLFQNFVSGTKKIVIKDPLGNEAEKELFYPDFEIGNVKFSDFAFVKQDFSSLLKNKCFPYDGILGANVLKKLNWKYSKKDNNLSFSMEPFGYENFDSPSPVQWHGSIPIVELRMNDYKFFAMIDTGHFGTIIMSEYAYNENFKDYKDLIKGKGNPLSTINGKQKTDLVKTKIKNFFWGNYDFSDYENIVLPIAPNIGNKIIFENGFIFNFLQNQMALGKSVKKFKDATLPKIKICKSDKNKGEIELCFFWDEPVNKDLKLHDQIIQVDSINTTDMNDIQYCNLLKYLDKEGPKKIKLKRGRKEYDYILEQ